MNNDNKRIAKLNDLCRTTLGIGNKFFRTQGIISLSEEDQSAIREKLERYNDFTEDNGPYSEHDFGSFEHNGQRIFWKIDYYAPDMQHGSEDPSDPKQTIRILTVMLAEEY